MDEQNKLPTDELVSEEETTAANGVTEEAIPAEADITPEEIQKEQPAPLKKKKKRHTVRNVFLLLLTLCVLAVAGLFYLYWKDSSGSGRSSGQIQVTIGGDCSSTAAIAQRLEDNGLIDHALFFRIYARLNDVDSAWQEGTFTLSPDMGFQEIMKALQTPTYRETVKITFPEGKNVYEIAAMLEEKGICSSYEFIEATQKDDFDYDFIKALPNDPNRVYRLEGYLFPDTYDFYLDSAPHEVVDRMLSNLDRKLTPEIRQQIEKRGWTIDEALIMASLVEGEAAKKDDMEKVSKVLQNRMNNTAVFPCLELCSTQLFIEELRTNVNGIRINDDAYDTYTRKGLPVGAINNPGLQAILSALNPSTDKSVQNCYFFATDYDTDTTYFTQTYSEHEAICRKYGIGIYG
ncbi:MAG: endolytic transglycosylase MltG [Ruminococcaceae bacterium]|nr:endolytic transglycosylase MltG [Oscillospiraceae bacterium]